MKRSERRHLKSNALAASITGLQQSIAARRRQATLWAMVIAAAVISSLGYLSWQERLHSQGVEMLADAMLTAQAPVVPPPPPPDPDNPGALPPPAAFQPGSYTSVDRRAEAALRKFLATADAYPDSPAGVMARYHAAAILSALGRRDEAHAQYEQVIGRAGDGLYGRMATLGLAETQLHSGNYDAAIELFETSSAWPDSDIPVDAILMRLGRAYALAGQTSNAQATFTRILDEFPNSLYQPEARAELDKLQTPTTP